MSGLVFTVQRLPIYFQSPVVESVADIVVREPCEHPHY